MLCVVAHVSKSGVKKFVEKLLTYPKICNVIQQFCKVLSTY